MSKIQNANELAVAVYSITIRGAAMTRSLKEQTADVTKDVGADQGVIHVNMYNLPKTTAKAINGAASKIRMHFIENAIQFGKGLFGVPLKVMPKFQEELDKLIAKHDAIVAGVVEDARSGKLYADLQATQGSEFDPTKVPTHDRIAGAYGVDVSLSVNVESAKVQDALKVLSNDFRESILAKVKADAEKENQEKLAASSNKIKDGIKDLLETVLKFEKEDTKGLHGKSVEDKLTYVLETLPGYNLVNDSEIDKMIEKIREGFKGVNKENIKEKGVAKDTAIATAKEVLTTLF